MRGIVHNVHTLKQFRIPSTDDIVVEVRDLVNGVHSERIVAIVVPGGWISWRLFNAARRDGFARNFCVTVRLRQDHGMNVTFMARDVPITVHLSPRHVSEIARVFGRIDELGGLMPKRVAA